MAPERGVFFLLAYCRGGGMGNITLCISYGKKRECNRMSGGITTQNRVGQMLCGQTVEVKSYAVLVFHGQRSDSLPEQMASYGVSSPQMIQVRREL
jgi:hypothetical protein